MNKFLLNILLILSYLTTAQAWRVDMNDTTQMKLTDTGRLWIGADGKYGKPKMAVTTTENDEDRALDVRADRESGNNYGIVATASGNGADFNIGLYGWASNATNNYGLFVDSGYGYFADRVGIGTGEPNAPLEIVHDTDGNWTKQLNVFSPNASNGQRAGMITFGIADETGQTGYMSYVKTGDGEGYIDFTVAGDASNIVTMRENGKVGIATVNTSDDKLYVDGAATADEWHTNSDKRLKKDIKPIQDALEKVCNLKGVTYRWKDINKTQKTQIGFIAQEVEKIVPEVVSKPKNKNQFYSLDYSKITALLVEAVKSLKKQNGTLKALVCEDHPNANICEENNK